MEYLKATVEAGSRRDSVALKNSRYAIATREPALNGRANRAALALLARYLEIPQKKLALVRGADKPAKLFLKRG